MGGLIERIKGWWQTSTATQRYTTLGGIALTMVLLVSIFTVASRPKYALLYGGLDQTAQAAIVTEIQTLGVPVKYDSPGIIEVPEDKVAELRMKLVTSGKVPKGAHMGTENLGEMNLYITPAVERERLKAIAEGTLATTIESNPGVRSARVHITLGDPSPFMDQQRPPSAAISIITGGNGNFSTDSARGIAMLVSHSIDGLDLKNVVVLDENSKPLYNGAELNDSNATAGKKIEMEQSFARKEEQRLQSLLDTIFGVSNTTVSVRCELDLDTVKKNTKNTVYTKGAAVKTMSEKMNGDGTTQRAAGVTANDTTPQAPATNDENGKGSYNSLVQQNEPNVTHTEEVRDNAMGDIKSMTINVAANTAGVKVAEGEDAATKKAEFVAKVQEFIDGEIATKSQTDAGNFQNKVTAYDFDNSAKTDIKENQEDAAKAARLQQLISMLPIAALLLVGAMVVRQLGKMTRNTTQVVTPDGQIITVPLVNGQIPQNYAMVHSQSTAMEPYENSQPLGEPQNSMEGLGTRNYTNNSEGGIIFHEEDEVLEVKKIREKKSAHLAAIKQMAIDRPEPTAMLIKSWLSEDEKHQR